MTDNERPLRVVDASELEDGDEQPGRLEYLRSRVFTAAELAALPPLAWTVPGLLPARGLGFIFGQSGHCKSFVTADIGLSLASGIAYAGRPIDRARTVLYVLAEGSAGFSRRIEAWQLHNPHGDIGDRFRVLPEPVNLADPRGIDAGYLADIARDVGAEAEFIDTLARAMTGADENSARDMGVFIANAERVARLVDGFVGVVHHSGKDETKGMRGSSAAFGGADVVIQVTKQANEVTVKNVKMKDSEEFPPLRFMMQPKGLSLALEYQDGLYVPPVRQQVLVDLVRLIEQHDDGTGVPGKVAEDAFMERTGRSRSGYYEVKAQAVTDRLIRNLGSDRQPRFMVTDAGRELADIDAGGGF